MSLTDKQRYFRYGESGWTYKEPPALADEIVRGMAREGLDRLYRVVWGGVAIYRTEPEQLTGAVRGDRRATKINDDSGRLQPSYLFGRARQPYKEWCCYRDAKTGRKVRATQESFVPPGQICWWETDYHYVEYGILHWFLEYLHEGEWHCVKRLETPEGFYYEPDARLLDIIRRREHENRNEDLDDVMRRERAVMAKIQAEAAETEERRKRKLIDDMTADHLRRAEARAVYPIHI